MEVEVVGAMEEREQPAHQQVTFVVVKAPSLFSFFASGVLHSSCV